MKIMSIMILAMMMMMVVGISNVQARMSVVLSQQSSDVVLVAENISFTTGDGETFLFASTDVAAKGEALQGQRVHILFHETNGQKYCVDLRPADQQRFEVLGKSKRGTQGQKKASQ